MAANVVTACQAWPVPELAIFFSGLCMSTSLADSFTLYRRPRNYIFDDIEMFLDAFLSLVKFFPFSFPVLLFLANCTTVCERKTAHDTYRCNELWWSQYMEIEFSDSQLFKMVLVLATFLASCMWLANRVIWSIAPFLPLWILAGLGLTNIFSFIFHQMLKTIGSMSVTFLNQTSSMLDPYESRHFAFSYRLFVVLLTMFKIIQTLSNLWTSEAFPLQMYLGILTLSSFMMGMFIFFLSAYALVMFFNPDISYLQIFASCYASWIAHVLTDRDLLVHIWEKGLIVLVPSVVIFIFFIFSSFYHLRNEARLLYVGSATLLLWYHMWNWLKRKAYWHEKAGELYESRGYHEKALAAYTVAGNYYFIHAQKVEAAKKWHLQSSQQRGCFGYDTAAVMYSRIAKMHVKDKHFQDAATFFIKAGNIFQLKVLCKENAASCFWDAAEAYRNAREYSQAADLFIKLSSMSSCGIKLANCYKEIASCFKLGRHTENATVWLQKAGDQYAEVISDNSIYRFMAAFMYQQVAEQYHLQNEKEKEAIWYKKSGEAYERAKNCGEAANAFRLAATLYDKLGNNDEALKCFLLSGKQWERKDDKEAGNNYHEFAVKYWKDRYYQGAAILYVKAGDSFGKASRQVNAAIAYGNAAHAVFKMKEYLQAAQLHIKASELYVCKFEVAECYRRTAECFALVQQIDKANEWFKKAGEKYAEMGMERNSAREEAAKMYIKVAEYYRSQDGKLGKSLVWYERSAKLYEAGEYFLKAALAYDQIATIHYDKLADFKTALTWHLKSGKVFECLNFENTLGEYFHGVAQKYWTDEQYQGAAVLYLKAGDSFGKMSRQVDASASYWNAAHSLFNMNEYLQAAQLYIKASELYDCQGKVAKCIQKAAVCYARVKQYGRAAELYERAGEAYTEVGQDVKASSEFNEAAKIFISLGKKSLDRKEAIDFFRKGADIYLRLNIPEDASQCYALIGEKYLEVSDQEKAAEYFYLAGKVFEQCKMWYSAIIYYTQATSLYMALKNGLSVDRNDESCARYEFLIVATTVSKFNVHLRMGQSYLLQLDRQSAIADVLANILSKSKNPANALHENVISVQFKDEIAAGSGVLVEFFSWIASLLVKGRRGEKENDVKEELYFILSESQHVFLPSPKRTTEADLDSYEAVGVILALAVHMKQQVPMPLARVVLKSMLKADEEFVITLDDIKDCDPVLYKSLIDLLQSDIGSGETMDYEWHGKQVGDGSYKMVTNENKEEFVKDVLLEIWRDRELQMKRMGNGFKRTINNEIFNVLTPGSLDLLLVGEQNIDVEEWKKVTKITGFEKGNPIIRWLWEIVEAMTQKERLALLQFWTGRCTLPVGGFPALGPAFSIVRSANAIEFLPTSATCSSSLRFPEYASKEMLTERLRVVLRYFEGFGFL